MWDALKGKTVLVTAGAGGLGRATAEAFAGAGAKVMICDSDDRHLESFSAANPLIVARKVDLSQRDEIDDLFRDLVARWPGLDILVNNVGVAGPTAAAEDVTHGEWQSTIDVNLTSFFLCAQHAIRLMKPAASGAIVNISSASARVGLPFRLPYVVSKAAVLSLTYNLARELGPFGIRVNSILPGAIDGPRMQGVIATKAKLMNISEEEFTESLLRFISLRSMVQAEHIVPSILFLASDYGRMISGQHLGVDGNLEYEE